MHTLAIISGESAINACVWLIVAGLICWILWWFIGYCGLPEPFAKVARILVGLVAVVIVINVLLSIAGHPIINWH